MLKRFCRPYVRLIEMPALVPFKNDVHAARKQLAESIHQMEQNLDHMLEEEH